jgi:hypothetical protein
MNRFLQFILLVAVVLFPSMAFSQATTRFCSLGTEGLVIDAKPMNGAASTLTFTFGPRECSGNVASYNWLVIEATFTHTTSGNVIFTCTTGVSVATADKIPQVCSGGGTCVAVDGGIISKAVTGNKKWAARLGIRGYRAWSCVASHDNTPAAGDILSANAYLTD